MRIRIAKRGDIAAMHVVRMAVRENRLVTIELTRADYLREIEEDGRAWLVEEQGHVLGFSVGNAGTGNVWALFVHPDHEGRGIGRLLHDAMVTWMFERGATRLWLTTAPGTRAEAFYLRAGWAKIGVPTNGEQRFELGRSGIP